MVKLKPEVGGDEIKVDLKDRKDGTYLAEYTVDKLHGEMTLSVVLRGAHIKGSPFSVLVERLNPPPQVSELSPKALVGLRQVARHLSREGRKYYNY